MTKEEALSFKARWQLVNEFINEEIRQMPLEVKLQQLAVMYGAGQRLGWAERMREGEELVWERWRRLKESLYV